MASASSFSNANIGMDRIIHQWPVPLALPTDPEWTPPNKYDVCHLQYMGFLLVSEFMYATTNLAEELSHVINLYIGKNSGGGGRCFCKKKKGVTSCSTKACVNFRNNIQCSLLNCVSDCANNWYSLKQFPKTGYSTGESGYGHCLVAKENIVKGTPVEEYFGVVSKGNLPVNQPHCLPIQLFKDSNLFVDGELFGSRGRMIAHSSTPNAEVQEWICGGKLHLIIVATRDIEIFQPITICYPQMMYKEQVVDEEEEKYNKDFYKYISVQKMVEYYLKNLMKESVVSCEQDDIENNDNDYCNEIVKIFNIVVRKFLSIVRNTNIHSFLLSKVFISKN